MDSNTHSTQAPAGGRAPALPEPPDDELTALATDVDGLAAQDLARLSAMVRTQRLLAWRRLLDRQEGLWLRELAALDAGGVAGADQGEVAASNTASTAAWLRRGLRMSAGVAHSTVRTARALFGGPLPQTAQALLDGEVSSAHAQAVVDGTHQLPDPVGAAAEAGLGGGGRGL